MLNLKEFMSLSFKFIERFNRFWNNKIIKPMPNSMAEKIKKKKVKDNIFRLS